VKYYILPAKDVQAGDVIFTNHPNGKEGIQFCGRVIGETRPRPNPELTQWRVEVVVGDDSEEEGTHTTISFRHNTLVGVAREDKFVDTDIASLLADLDAETK
jgi:hypothetical protein